MEEETKVQNSFSIPEEYKPLSVGQFLGYTLLMSIPCVGLILVIIFACGGVKNKNVINWARAQLIIMGIAVIIYILILVFGVGTAIYNAALSTMSY